METAFVPSLALQTANKRLNKLRQQNGASDRCEANTSFLPELPAHLGWGVIAVSKKAQRSQYGRHMGNEKQKQSSTVSHPPSNPKAPNLQPNIAIAPSLALAMLKEGQVAAGRVWWLCRHLDSAGSGTLRIAMIKQQLTHKDSPIQLCGWRRLRQLLTMGEGLFWTRQGDRLFLRSAVKVADRLGVGHFAGKMVSMSAVSLCHSIGNVRALFYASFHAGRQKMEGGRGTGDRSQLAVSGNASRKQNIPISRATLERLTGASRRTQQAYEQNAGIHIQQHILIGDTIQQEDNYEAAYQHGGAYFTLKDYQGQNGRRGAIRHAWQLPNSYHSTKTSPVGRGRQKYLNRALNDLRMKREAGNAQALVELISRRYYKDGGSAGKARNREPSKPIYWQAGCCVGGKGRWVEMSAVAG